MSASGSDNLMELFHAIACEDDKHAFEKLFCLYYTKLVNFAAEYVKSQETAEDIIADLFTRLWIKRQSLKDVRYPEVYLFKAAKNSSLNSLRKFSSLRVTLMDEDELLGENMGFVNCPQSSLENKELFLQLAQAIEALPPQSRLIVRLIKEDGLKAKEVAEILQVSVRTVENQLYRALCRLEKVLALHPQKKNKPTFRMDNLSLLMLFFS